MVHISEVANSFVSDIKDFLTEGQMVKVKVINIDQAGRINLSIKKAQQPGEDGGASARPQAQQRRPAPRPRGGAPRQAPRDPATMTFEDKLKMFMADSESRMADIKHNNDRKSGSRRRKQLRQEACSARMTKPGRQSRFFPVFRQGKKMRLPNTAGAKIGLWG